MSQTNQHQPFSVISGSSLLNHNNKINIHSKLLGSKPSLSKQSSSGNIKFVVSKPQRPSHCAHQNQQSHHEHKIQVYTRNSCHPDQAVMNHNKQLNEAAALMYKSVLTTANHSKERQSIIDVPDKKGMHNRRRSDAMKAGEKENATGSVVMPPTRQIILPSLSSTFQSKNKVIGIKRMTSGSSNGGWQAPQANVVKKQPIVGYRKDNQAGSESS